MYFPHQPCPGQPLVVLPCPRSLAVPKTPCSNYEKLRLSNSPFRANQNIFQYKLLVRKQNDNALTTMRYSKNNVMITRNTLFGIWGMIRRKPGMPSGHNTAGCSVPWPDGMPALTKIPNSASQIYNGYGYPNICLSCLVRFRIKETLWVVWHVTKYQGLC